MVTREDFNTHLYAELIEAIDRNDEDTLGVAIASAEAEASGYLSRYDTESLFAALDDERDPALLMYLKDMTVWHFITIGNPNTDLEFRKTRYDDALRWLGKIQSGKVVPKGWPPATEEGTESFFHVASAPKRRTRW